MQILVKILHAPFGYFPDVVGGTETYVRGLTTALRNLGIESVVAAAGTENREYEYGETRVRRWRAEQRPPIEAVYGPGDPASTRRFLCIVDEERPDVVHLHAKTTSHSLTAVRELHQRGVPVVFTCHVAGTLCPRATLLRWGRSVCNGELEEHTCAACVLQGCGAPQLLARAAAATPNHISSRLGALSLSGGMWTALRMRSLLRNHFAITAEFVHEVDRMVVPARWLRDLLILNGFDGESITVSAQATEAAAAPYGRESPVGRESTGTLRIAFLSRAAREKGADILVRALRARPELPVQLDLYVSGTSLDTTGLVSALSRMARADRRIRILPGLDHKAVSRTLAGYDALAVPSRVLEVAPLVVLEAFAAGIPVVGMDRAGIRELVTHEVDGLLVADSDPESWAHAFEMLIVDERLLQRLRDGVLEPRLFEAVAVEMIEMYKDLLTSRACTA